MNTAEHYARLNAMPRSLHADYHKALKRQRRHVWTTFALWLTCGLLGAHKLYLKQRALAIAYFTMATLGLGCCILAMGTAPDFGALGALSLFISIVCACSLLIGLLMDFFELKRETAEANEEIQQALSAHFLSLAQSSES